VDTGVSTSTLLCFFPMGDEKDKNARQLILARRARFLKATLAGVAAATTAIGACSSDESTPRPCLDFVEPDAQKDTSSPQPCLSIAADSGPKDAAVDGDAADEEDADASDKDASPMPCLSPPAPDQ